MVSIHSLDVYDVSLKNGFLPSEPPLETLPGSYYEPWEYIVRNLQGLILSKRLREVVDRLPTLSTEHLHNEPQWRRAYSVLAFVAHAYIWGGDKPAERVPPPVTIPFLEACRRLELPPVATYAGLVLWNWKPIFDQERTDTLGNLDTINTFTGALDEKWFYLISIAIEARGAPIIPLMLRAIEAADQGDRATVTECLRSFAERLDELGAMLARMYDSCDPHVFYHRIRPFLAGSKNMAAAGLPDGVIFDDGGPINKQRYVQFSGGSNAQSSIIQFFDIVLDVHHRTTGVKKGDEEAAPPGPTKKAAKPEANFIHEMRQYMPGPHARFLEQMSRVANIRRFVQAHAAADRALSLAFDACLAMLSAFRDKHIQMVSRYIIVKSREAKKDDDVTATMKTKKINLAHRPQSVDGRSGTTTATKKDLKGTGGTSLIPFLRQARDETGEPAVDVWTRRLLNKARAPLLDDDDGLLGPTRISGLSGVWQVGDNTAGGLCHW